MQGCFEKCSPFSYIYLSLILEQMVFLLEGRCLCLGKTLDPNHGLTNILVDTLSKSKPYN